jgi:hypothetical protein
LPAGVTRQCDLTPKARHFYKKAKRLQQVAAQWRNKQYSVRRKLNFLKGKEEMLTYLKDVNEVTAQFFYHKSEHKNINPGDVDSLLVIKFLLCQFINRVEGVTAFYLKFLVYRQEKFSLI